MIESIQDYLRGPSNPLIYNIILFIVFLLWNTLIIPIIFLRLFSIEKYRSLLDTFLPNEIRKEIKYIDIYKEEIEDYTPYFIYWFFNIALLSLAIVWITSVWLLLGIDWSKGLFSFIYIAYFAIIIVFHKHIFHIVFETPDFLSFFRLK